jgi:hypothetical protein
MTSDLAQTKAIRRRELRDAFPPPLNQIALRHVDSIAALNDVHRLILSKAIQKTDFRYAAIFIDALNKDEAAIHHEDDLVALIRQKFVKHVHDAVDHIEANQGDSVDTNYLATLLMKCYPDMPPASATALAKADVMDTSLRVVRATRNAVNRANSDFVVVALFTLFEEKLNELRELINVNPSFIKAIQLSRTDWK